MTVTLAYADARALPLPDCSVDAIVCDPPYGLEFMGREWDSFKTGRSAAYQQGGALHDPADRRGKGGAGPDYTKRPAKRCQVCGKQSWSGSPCRCEQPQWEIDNSPLLAFQAWCESWAREAYRVLKPGGHLLALGRHLRRIGATYAPIPNDPPQASRPPRAPAGPTSGAAQGGPALPAAPDPTYPPGTDRIP